MSLIEKKLDAVIRHLTAGTDVDRAATLEELRKIAAGTDAPPVDRGLEYDVRRVLLDIGVPENIYGHRYLVKALCLTVRRPSLVGWVTKELYPEVADEFRTTPARVERAIRHAIEVAWEQGDLDTLQRYFGNTISPSKGRPTNSQFISRITNVVRQYAE